MREKLVIIGAGSAMFTRGLVADLLRVGWDCELALVDIDSEALAVAEGVCRKMIEAKGAPIHMSASTNRRDVLAGATVVISVIGVGGRRAWEQDVFIPRKYGIYQPVGDSVMPGGTSRALRMVPPMVEIAKDVLALAPDALFINYANPMPVICRAVRKATEAPVIGLCHGVHGTANQIARWLSVDPAELRYTAVGINHLTWFLEVRHQGLDLMPKMQERAATVLPQLIGRAPAADEGSAAQDGLDRLQPFCLQLMQVFGAFPAVGDRHVTEFFPQFFPEGNHFGRTLGVERFSFEQTIARGDEIYAEMREMASSAEPLDEAFFEAMGGEHEQAIEIVESIRQDLGHVYSANLPNTGQVPNLPLDAIIEAPAVADAAGLKPISQSPLPAGLAGTLATRCQWVETVVEAALEGSRDKFVQALLLDGAVTDVHQAKSLADELLATHAQYLPQFGVSG